PRGNAAAVEPAFDVRYGVPRQWSIGSILPAELLYLFSASSRGVGGFVNAPDVPRRVFHVRIDPKYWWVEDGLSSFRHYFCLMRLSHGVAGTASWRCSDLAPPHLFVSPSFALEDFRLLDRGHSRSVCDARSGRTP